MWIQKFSYNRGAKLRALSTSVFALSIAACAPPQGAYRDASQQVPVPLQSRRAITDTSNVFDGQDTLTIDALLGAVLASNSSVEQARQGWRAALARYPEATSLEDPMVSFVTAPLSIFSDAVRYGQVIEVSQSFPYPGKRKLRGQAVLAEANVAQFDQEAMRLKVARLAVALYFDLYFVNRSLEAYKEFERELTEHRETLTAHLAAGHAWQDDALKVDMDLGDVAQIRNSLDGDRDVLIAQINSLLHRRPDLALPPLPPSLAVPASIDATSESLQERAIATRPELRSAAAKRDGEDAKLELANRDFYPDFKIMGQYNSMWPRLEHQLMVGIGLNIPLQRDRRHAAVEVARARRGRAMAGLDVEEDKIRSEVQRTYKGYEATLKVLETYQQDIIPAAQERIAATRASLDSGRTSFIEVLRADHDLLMVKLRFQKALSNAERQRAELAISIGEISPAIFSGDQP